MSFTSWIKVWFDMPYILYIFGVSVVKATIRQLTSKKKNLNESIILVVGAASGIGQHTVCKLAQLFPNAVFVLWDINAKGLNSTKLKCKEYGACNVYTYIVDVSKREDIFKTAILVKRQVGTVSVLFNNAGIADLHLFLEADPLKEERVIQVNLMANMWTTRAFLPDMIRKGKGHLVTTCSGLGLCRAACCTSYVASKYALRGFIESLSLEMRQHPAKPDIKFSTIYPAMVKTPLTEGVITYKPRYDFKNVSPMNAGYVADKIVDGILKEKCEIMIPGSVGIIAVLYRIWPTEFVDRLETFIFQDQVITPKS